MGLILGGLSFLNIIVNSGLGGFLEEFSFSVIYNRIAENFSLIMVVGILSIIPFKIIQSVEGNMVEI